MSVACTLVDQCTARTVEGNSLSRCCVQFASSQDLHSRVLFIGCTSHVSSLYFWVDVVGLDFRVFNCRATSSCDEMRRKLVTCADCPNFISSHVSGLSSHGMAQVNLWSISHRSGLLQQVASSQTCTCNARWCTDADKHELFRSITPHCVTRLRKEGESNSKAGFSVHCLLLL